MLSLSLRLIQPHLCVYLRRNPSHLWQITLLQWGRPVSEFRLLERQGPLKVTEQHVGLHAGESVPIGDFGVMTFIKPRSSKIVIVGLACDPDLFGISRGTEPHEQKIQSAQKTS